jgi:hypothetical protein
MSNSAQYASDPDVPLGSDSSRSGLKAVSFIAAASAFTVTWGGAVALAWHDWLGSSSWWHGQPVASTTSLRLADEQLFLKGALMVTAVVLVACVALALLHRRNRGAAQGLAWALAGVGAILWLVGPISAPSIDEASVRCTNVQTAQTEEAAGSLAIRGWSWTHFSAHPHLHIGLEKYDLNERIAEVLQS